MYSIYCKNRCPEAGDIINPRGFSNDEIYLYYTNEKQYVLGVNTNKLFNILIINKKQNICQKRYKISKEKCKKILIRNLKLEFKL